MVAQQHLLENALGLEPAAEDELPVKRRTQDYKWMRNLRAARQFHAREGTFRYRGSMWSPWSRAVGRGMVRVALTALE